MLRRDGGCCVFPGCRHATFVDLHHLHLKSEGGDHDPDKLVTVCGAHHRAIHRGLVTIKGSDGDARFDRRAGDHLYRATLATLR